MKEWVGYPLDATRPSEFGNAVAKSTGRQDCRLGGDPAWAVCQVVGYLGWMGLHPMPKYSEGRTALPSLYNPR
jgi:hypothetical protein